MNRDFFGAIVKATNKTHKMNTMIEKGETDLNQIALYAYGGNDITSVGKVKIHIKWLCEVKTHNSGSVRDRMKSAGIDKKTIDERLKWVKGQFPDIDNL